MNSELVAVTVDVYHFGRGFVSRGSLVAEEEYTLVARVSVDIADDCLLSKTQALNLAFRLTNNIDSSWSLDPDDRVVVLGELPVHDGQQLGYRSTSVDDRMCVTINGISTWYDVAPIGFEEVIF